MTLAMLPDVDLTIIQSGGHKFQFRLPPFMNIGSRRYHRRVWHSRKCRDRSQMLESCTGSFYSILISSSGSGDRHIEVWSSVNVAQYREHNSQFWTGLTRRGSSWNRFVFALTVLPFKCYFRFRHLDAWQNDVSDFFDHVNIDKPVSETWGFLWLAGKRS